MEFKRSNGLAWVTPLLALPPLFLTLILYHILIDLSIDFRKVFEIFLGDIAPLFLDGAFRSGRDGYHISRI